MTDKRALISGVSLAFLLTATLLAGCATPSPRPAGIPDNWVEISGAGIFVLYAPPGTRYVRERGIDSFVGKFRHPDFEIEFDYGVYGHSIEQVPSRLVNERLVLDGKHAVIFTELGSIYGYPLERDAICVGLATGTVEDPPPIPKERPDEEDIDLPPLTLDMSSCTNREDTIDTIKRVYRTIQFNERF